MSIITGIFTWIGAFAVQVISTLGYGGIIVLMALESMVAPVPSELVMPFAGFLAATGRFSLVLVILLSGVGSIIGSLLSYFIGRYGGNPLALRFGKYLFLDPADLETAEKWFAAKGDRTIFICRFIPVIRHVISIPAGIAKMNVWKFCIYTFFGAVIWNAILAYAGYYLGQQWEIASKYVSVATDILAPIIVLVLAYMAWRHIRHATRRRDVNARLAADAKALTEKEDQTITSSSSGHHGRTHT